MYPLFVLDSTRAAAAFFGNTIAEGAIGYALVTMPQFNAVLVSSRYPAARDPLFLRVRKLSV